MKNLYRKGLLLALAVCLYSYTDAQIQPDVNVNVDISKTIGDMKPIWAWFGHDEPNYTYMKDGRKLLTELSQLGPVPVYMRVHNLMTSGDGTPALKWGSTNIYTEDANGNPIYNYRIVDSIFDTYIKRGMKPLAQLGFMPEALSTRPQPYQHHWKPGIEYKAIETGWAYPPKDYKKWGDLVYNWVKHCVNRYGAKEVASWYWEVWNEPDGAYWKGTPTEFYKLYDYAADGVKRALPSARIGGCNVTGGGMKFLTGFLNHCLKDTNFVTGKIGSPLDAVLFHAKGSPRISNGQVRMGISNQLRNMNNMFKLISSYPQLNSIPVIIGESDPEGCAACGMNTNPENAYRNGTLYSSYTAASFARAYLLADQYHINLIGAVSWSFEFEDQPWFAGFRDLATNGVDKPVLNVFRMFGMMKGKRVEVQDAAMYDTKLVVDSGIRKQADVGALASTDSKTAAVMLWNYHDEDNNRVPHNVVLHVNNIPVKTVNVTCYLVDWDHSNSYEVWKKMGSPQNPAAEQITELEKAGMLKMNGKPVKMNTAKGTVGLKTTLQAQAVELVKIDW
ncbi:GH39 family glycosyl hydrolase [Mucilaginibacter boryungensis]|uniref:Beta-xylosidase n=1 Tax=Mucilaginibacter boryungensis TaxID=768480 RepID=A0ABR9XG92_9SPHI|nr:beta-xylosidase [Mucilaginibacter boryungensis]MBE9666408.1 beta-xylosidase [Mucilaginibacter boryungensis]